MKSRRTPNQAATKPPAEERAKTVKRPSTTPAEPYRIALASWSVDDRDAWEERVAIMMEGAGLSVEQAEEAAFHDVAKRRSAT